MYTHSETEAFIYFFPKGAWMREERHQLPACQSLYYIYISIQLHQPDPAPHKKKASRRGDLFCSILDQRDF